jgi:hypothetical protein
LNGSPGAGQATQTQAEFIRQSDTRSSLSIAALCSIVCMRRRTARILASSRDRMAS